MPELCVAGFKMEALPEARTAGPPQAGAPRRRRTEASPVMVTGDIPPLEAASCSVTRREAEALSGLLTGIFKPAKSWQRQNTPLPRRPGLCEPVRTRPPRLLGSRNPRGCPLPARPAAAAHSGGSRLSPAWTRNRKWSLQLQDACWLTL